VKSARVLSSPAVRDEVAALAALYADPTIPALPKAIVVEQ